MIALLFLIGVVYWIGSDYGDTAGIVALAVLIMAVLIGIVSGGRKCDKAYVNLVDYWAEGGPKKK